MDKVKYEVVKVFTREQAILALGDQALDLDTKSTMVSLARLCENVGSFGDVKKVKLIVNHFNEATGIVVVSKADFLHESSPVGENADGAVSPCPICGLEVATAAELEEALGGYEKYEDYLVSDLCVCGN